MLVRKKEPNEFLKILRQKLKDFETVDLAYRREAISQIVKNDRFYKELNVDLGKIDRVTWLQEMFDCIKSVISQESRKKIDRQIAFGEFLLKKANACCGTPEQYCHTFWKRFGPLCNRENLRELRYCPCHVCEEYKGQIIGIHRGLFMLFFSVIKLLLAFPKMVYSYTGGEEKEVFEPLLSKEEVVSTIYHIVELETQGKIPFLPPEPIFKDRRFFTWSHLSGYAYLFVMAHELSHFLLGHTVEDPLVPVELESQTIEAFAWTENQEREFEADEAGVAILLNFVYSLNSDFEIMNALAGVESVFLIFELCERIGRNLPSMSHPSSKDRIFRLRQKYRFPNQYYAFSDVVHLEGKSILEDMVEKYKL